MTSPALAVADAPVLSMAEDEDAEEARLDRLEPGSAPDVTV
jgi:hypothetical protein